MDSVDKNWSWVVLFAAFLANLLAGGIVFSFGILFTDFRDRLETGILETVMIGAIAFALLFFSAPISRFMADRLGYRFVTVAGSVLDFLGLLLGCFAPSIHYYYVFFGFFVGCGYGMVMVATTMVVEDYFHRGGTIALTISACGFPTGVFILPLVTRALLDTYSFFGTFMILSALMLNCIVCGLLFRPLVKNVVIERDKHTYKRMSSPVENGMGNSVEDSNNSNGDKEDMAMDPGGKPGRENASINKQKLPKYKSLDAPEETIVIPASEPIRFDDFSVEYEEEEDSDTDTEEPPKDKEDEPVTRTVDSAPAPREHVEKPFDPDQDHSTEEVKDKPKTLLNVIIGVNEGRLLCDVRLVLYLFASMLFSMGFGITCCFYPDISRDYGYSDTKAEWTLSLLGLGSCTGIVLSGFLRRVLTDRLERRAAVLVCSALVLASPCVLQFFTNYSALLLGAFLVGLFSVVFYFLRRDVVCEMLPEDYQSSAFNISLWICGFGYIIGIPVAAYLRENHDTYKWSFVMAAVCFGTAALFIFPLIFLRRRQSAN